MRWLIPDFRPHPRPPPHTHACTAPHAGYVMQYAPSLGWAFLKMIGPKRARAVSSGKSGYDVQGLLSGKDD